ncbi:AT-rich interaction domain 6 [Etheostoma cragini]|uniref:AT-rich interaction domain 6 n=1 Tax=Etheostoma cragini TaxID=417921 RepID=UPI00155DEB92|nr:AT-rich interaction domain 6 [Etheostoma cragini]
METQANIEMSHTEKQEEISKDAIKDLTEEQFLKDLYLFMKTKDTPIERIPNLGFKQIDLFLMYKVVRDLGGYHQVTAQQLWKQVYNTLGGNPRSTSAATCTRRHYEKLLLPYECHVRGALLNVLPCLQPKHFVFPNCSKNHVDGQRPIKRKLPSIYLYQNPNDVQPDPHESVFPLQPHFPPYYQFSNEVLPPHVPMYSSILTPHKAPAPKPWDPLSRSCINLTDTIQEPLQQLRFLAEQYKTTSGLTEPLNLSVNKASGRETDSSPASSFTAPSSSKNPKFLNKPSPLYSPHHQQVVRDDGCEVEDGEADLGDTPYSYPVNAKEAYAVDVEAITASISPTYESAPTLRTDEGAPTMAQKPSSPKTDLTIQPKQEREGSPEVRELNLSHMLPGIPQQNGGKMEIEVPLSVFNNWLRLSGSSALNHGAKQLPPLPHQEGFSRQGKYSDTNVLPHNLTYQMNPSLTAEDLRLWRSKLPSPIPATQSTSHPYNTNQNHFTTYEPSSSGGILKHAASRVTYPFDPQGIKKLYCSKPPISWDAYKVTQASPIQINTDPSPLTVQQDFTASVSYNGNTMHLTYEEVMKLKKMLSNSS